MTKHILRNRARRITLTRPSRRGTQRATALVVLGVVSSAWTVSLVGAGAGATVTAETPTNPTSDAGLVEARTLEEPANYSTPEVSRVGIPQASGNRVVPAASTNGIPAAALAAYQRAATVINAADKNCNAPWQLVAAIGRVESDHGRYGNNTLGKDGVSRPGIYGIPLNGKNRTQKIVDTDAGQYDRDAKFDRAVGPMQFIPSTWSVVGVDADGDGKRNPQDIDDAALASVVHLCSGDTDLGTEVGQRSAIFRYNHSQEYVEMVLRLMGAYSEGLYTSVPNNTASASYIPRDYTFSTPHVATAIGSPDGTASEEAADGSAMTGATGSGEVSRDPRDPAGPMTPSTDPAEDGGNPLEKTVTESTETVKKTIKKPVETVTRTVKKVGETANCVAADLSSLDLKGLTNCVGGLLNP